MKKMIKEHLYRTPAIFILTLIYLCSINSLALAGKIDSFPGNYSHSLTSDPWIALTFDDGPHMWYTSRILEALENDRAKASFFLVGKLCIRYPELVEEIFTHGHSIANHTFNHWNMTRLNEDRCLFEWLACSEAIENIIGEKTRFCRPPGGKLNEDVIKSAERAGLMVITWTINSLDCSGKSSDELKHIILSRLEPGAIILLHDGFVTTLEALPDLIRIIREKGYKLVTLDEMFYKR